MPGSDSSPLWACLWFAQLALDCLAQDGRSPLVVVDTVLGKPRVHLANAAARQRGVAVGMALDVALSLCPGLISRARDRDSESACLQGLAAWAFGYSGSVALHPPDALCVEIGGSLSLFGGLQAVIDRLQRDLGQQGYVIRLSVAPTVRAAYWLASSGAEVALTRRSELTRRLSALPASLLSLEPGVREALHGLGMHTLGDVLRLPRGGFARRLGDEPLIALDRALGRLPDPQLLWTPPPRFHQKVMLPLPVTETDRLVFAARRLLRALAGFLQGLSAGTRALVFSLVHQDGPDTLCPLELMRADRDADRLLGLLRERLERVQLRQPVEAIALTVERVEQLAGRDGRLFDDGPEDDGGAGMVERLTARLGADAVQSVAPVADHRPEKAWTAVKPGEPIDASDIRLPRPTWLLPEPVELTVVDETPHHDGIPLVLLAGPERIEAGWWDGEPVVRDYFVARDAIWRTFWVYRDLRADHRWYLHGVFG